MEHSGTFPISEALYWPMLGIKEELAKLFAEKFNCQMELKGPRLAAPPSGAEELVYEKKLPGGLRLSVWKGDLTGQDVDAVVNAANEDLDHIGGLAFALARAGGAVIQEESWNHIAKHGKVKAGSIAVTSAGNLPCKVLIHAVGPRWADYKRPQCESELREAITCILSHVISDRRIRSVALPAVSSGIFGFPLPLCAEIIVKVIENFNSQVKCDHLQEIRLVNNDDKTVDAMRVACEKILGRSDSPIGSQGTRQTANRHGAASGHAPPAFSINGLNLYLKKGNIEEQSTDIIVNSASVTLDLSKGQLSNAILTNAGQELQYEINNYKPSAPIGAVLPTSGFRLPCQFVYHTILPFYRERYHVNPEQVLHTVVTQCLVQAASTHKRQNPKISISFPTLGIGMLGFPKKLAAEIMTQTVFHFAWNSRCMLDVYFVIHPGDVESYKVFQEAISTVQKSNNITVGAEEPRDISSEDEKMSIIIRGESSEDVQEAETFLTQNILVPESVLIQNKHILLFGKKEHRALGSPQFSRVEISEVLGDGKASLEIKGPQKDVAMAAVQVELMLLEVQEEQAEKLRDELCELGVQWLYEGQTESGRYPGTDNRRIEEAYVTGSSAELTVGGKLIRFDFINLTATAPGGTYRLHRECLLARDYIPRGHQGGKVAPLFVLEPVNPSVQEFKNRAKEFQKVHLEVVKMVKIHNKVLSAVFQSKKGSDKGLQLYKRVPADFCKLIAKVGFNRLYQGSGDAEYEGGICFNKQLEDVLEVPAGTKGLVCIFQAEVALGRSEKWNVPPAPLAAGALGLYDSYVDSLKTPKKVVLFDGHRANPQYWFVCKWKGSRV